MSDWTPTTRQDYLRCLMSPWLHVNQVSIYLAEGLKLSHGPEEIREMIQRGAEAAQEDFNDAFLTALVLVAKDNGNAGLKDT